MSFPATVSAIAINETGSFDVIEKLEVSFPQQKPNEIVLKLAAGAMLAAATYALPAWWLLVAAGDFPPGPALGLIAFVPMATLFADALVAAPGSSALTENRALVLSLVQSLLSLSAWSLFSLQPISGWLLLATGIGGMTWLYNRRLVIWLPRTRW